MKRLTALFLTLLLLLTACAAPFSEASAISEEQPQESRTEASSSSETSAPEEPVQDPTPEPTPEPTPTPAPLAWYVPLETIPDFETYFAAERYIRYDESYNHWSGACEYIFYVGENGSPYPHSIPYEELSDHNLYRDKRGNPHQQELWLEADFHHVQTTERWVFVFDNAGVCWRMTYPDGELKKVCDIPPELNYKTCGAPADSGLLLFDQKDNTYYALYTPTGECFELGPVFPDTSYSMMLTNRSYYFMTIPQEERGADYQPGIKHYIYSGTEKKVFEVDMDMLGLRTVKQEDVPLLFPLDENGVPLHGDHLREVSLEEAGMAPGVSAADTDVVL